MERTHGSYTKRYGPSKIFSDNRGVVQALHKGEVDCISAGHEDADLWVWVWSKVDECVDQDINIRVVRTTALTTFEEKAKMLPKNRQVNVKTDEFPKTGAIKDGSEVAERIAEDALDTRKKVHAAI